jgi:hypothetical protein
VKTLLHLILIVSSILAVSYSDDAVAQQTLPKGVGLFRLGYRQYLSSNYEYDAVGNHISTASKYGLNIDSSMIPTDSIDTMGAINEKLEGKPLLSGLAKIFGGLVDTQNIVDSAIKDKDFGKIGLDADVSSDAKYLAIGFGLTNKLTIYAAVPYVNVSISPKLKYTPPALSTSGNSIDKMIDEKISEMKADIPDLANDYIKDLGYESLDTWEYSGIGDIQLGLVFANTFNLSSSFNTDSVITTNFYLPTGYQKSADRLHDTDRISLGYYQLEALFSQSLVYKKGLNIGVDAGFGYGFATSMERRLPELNSSALLGIDRKTTVNLDPGMDMDFGASTGVKMGIFGLGYRVAYKTHDMDKYSGEMIGDYSALSRDKSSLLYQTPSISIDTTNLYLRKKFPIPFNLKAQILLPISGQNIGDQTSFEITLQSYFMTPMASLK